ncbi:methyl-accepting chemotaxis protein [Pseudomonas oryzihabitans]|nr:methyl-accepting chemotaxis protein [Pseudomonas oryzihabitans]MDT3719913.1 methyl-accepting chemotaxis protein [Pseudomonas oryzihabitans]
MDGMARYRLANWLTATKLAVGFGLVLLLTLVVAIQGGLALKDVEHRFGSLKDMAAINRQMMQVRALEQGFRLTGDKALSEHLQKALPGVLEGLAKLSGEVSGADAAGVNAAMETIKAYGAAFTEFERLNTSRRLAMEGATFLVEGAANSLDILQSGLLDDGTYALRDSQGKQGAELLALSQQVGELYRLMLKSLDEAQARASKSAVDDSPLPSAAAALAQLAKVEPQLTDPAYSSVIQDVSTNIKEFTARLGDYAAVLAKEQTAGAGITTLADTAVQRVDALYGQQEAELQAMMAKRMLAIAGIALLALVVGTLAAVFITLAIVRPLRKVIAAAERIAEGELDVDLKVDRGDEIGQLQRSSASMVAALRGMVLQLQSGIARLGQAAEALAEQAREAQLGMTRQREETDQVAAAMAQLAATAHSVAEDAEGAAGAVDQAERRVNDGQAVVGRSLAGIETLGVDVRAAAESLQAVSRDSQAISAVLDVIKAVAEQTNLLALNAAIEAARAGDQGRGFAVVADEVRALAKRTQQSSIEIEQLISVLQRGSNEAVDRMQQSEQLLSGTVTNATDTRQAFDEIATAVASIQQKNQQIAAAAVQQSAVAEEVAVNVTRIRDGADQTSEVMAATALASRELADLGDELTKLVRRFRV